IIVRRIKDRVVPLDTDLVMRLTRVSEQATHIDEDRQAEDAVDNGRDAGKIPDVELNEAVERHEESALRLVLFQEDGGPDAERDSRQSADAADPHGAPERRPDTRSACIA